MNKSVKSIVTGGCIAAIYVVLSMLCAALGLASGVIQVRISEALCILPIMTGAAVPGLFVGCLVANALSGCALWDIVFGSLATLVGAVGTRLIGSKHPIISLIPPILANVIVVPLILTKVYAVPDAYWVIVLTVGLGEVLSCGVCGFVLYKMLHKRKIHI